MYLKSLEVQGFKSFANKLVFEFHDGITAIVGPNGSGKSNVADAVRWVLGEQSAKQLRGAKMEDVIFAGTELKRPLGFAYVAITLSNEDHKLNVPYEEVTVSRRVYRSGESEYMINQTACRLKDIHELFFDTGVGKEGYSIIGQGQIDKILSGRPDDRRELFDEAVGIVKYKKRKSETEKQLDHERENMVRIEDILSELERQRGPLNEEAAVAKRYLELRDELKKYEVNMFLVDYDDSNKKTKHIDENIKTIDIQFAEKEKEIEGSKSEYEKIEEEIRTQEEHIESIREKISSKEIEKNNCDNNIEVIKKDILIIRNNEEHYNERHNALTDEIKRKTKEKDKYIESKKENEEKSIKLDEERKESNDNAHKIRITIKGIEKDIAQKTEEIRAEMENGSQIKTSRQKYTTLMEQTSIQKANINQKLLKNKAEYDSLTEKAEIEKDLIEDKSESLQSLDAIDKTLEESIQNFKNKNLHISAELNEIQSQFHMKNSSLLSIKNMTERYEGYGQSIKRVMEQKNSNPGIIGVVADVIKTQKKFETAIETALGGQIQNIVTDSQNTARSMIDYLKKNRFGRATFLPLDAITPSKSNIPESTLNEKGALGIASSLVEGNKKFDILLEYLLGRVLVVDNIDNAIKIANKYNHRIRMVTLEGDQINPGGAMSGGAYKNSNNLLGRRREIENLEKEVKELQVKLINLKKAQEENNRLFERERAKQEGNQKLRRDLQIELNTAKVNYDRYLEDIEKNRTQKADIEAQMEDFEGQLKNINSKASEYDDVLKESLDKREKLEIERQELERNKKELNKQLNDTLNLVNNLFTQSSTYSNQAIFDGDNIHRLNEEIIKAKHELDELEDDNTNFDSRLKEKEEEIEKIKESKKGIEEEERHLKRELNGTVADNEDLKSKNKEFLKRQEDLINEKNSLDKEKIRLSNQREKITESMDNLINYMWEQYEITYNQALLLKQDLKLDDTKLKKKVQEIRTDIKKLGDVNVNSIDKSIEVNERYELYSSQHDDIVKATDNLMNIIAELDERMRITFKEQFAKINESFNKVFQVLFGGGKGHLELTDEGDVLTSGIAIIAQPPGKKLQNMMQLSGGEKALTAISLLFAIQKLKPSPFCLLDEIEAALDDSNVDRFAQYLHKLTKDTQFIVITHRRGTMNQADILYGITMQEKGISTLVSVDLVEAEGMVEDKRKEKDKK